MQFRILPEDYLAGVRLNLRPRAAWAAVGLVVLALAALAIMLGVWDLMHGKAEAWDVIGVLAIGYFPVWYFVYLPIRVRKLYKQQRMLNEPHEVTFSESGVSTTHSTGSGTLPWSNIHKWRESDELFLIYQSDALFSIFPKRHFGLAGEIERFRHFLASSVGPANSSFKPKPLRGSA